MTESQQQMLPFMKMHGLGNDFVVVDQRLTSRPICSDLAIAMGDRHLGIGFDQLATIETADGADAALTFWNQDGSTSAACGNATRCIARYLMDEMQKTELRLQTERGVLLARAVPGGGTSVNMGHPELDWRGVPIASEMNTLKLPIEGEPTATGMGNPHCTFFVDDAEAVDLAGEGPRLEQHPLFPQRTNVQFVSLAGPDRLRVRVWERGVGMTLASGSSSCAVAVAAARRGLTGKEVTICLDGGELAIIWKDDGVWMTGPTAHVFDGKWLLT